MLLCLHNTWGDEAEVNNDRWMSSKKAFKYYKRTTNSLVILKGMFKWRLRGVGTWLWSTVNLPSQGSAELLLYNVAVFHLPGPSVWQPMIRRGMNAKAEPLAACRQTQIVQCWWWHTALWKDPDCTSELFKAFPLRSFFLFRFWKSGYRKKKKKRNIEHSWKSWGGWGGQEESNGSQGNICLYKSSIREIAGGNDRSLKWLVAEWWESRTGLTKWLLSEEVFWERVRGGEDVLYIVREVWWSMHPTNKVCTVQQCSSFTEGRWASDPQEKADKGVGAATEQTNRLNPTPCQQMVTLQSRGLRSKLNFQMGIWN